MSETRWTNHTSTDGPVWTEAEYAALNSIEVTRNAKGDYQWAIKRYYRPDEEAEQVVSLIAQIDADLRQRYIPKPPEKETAE